MVSLIIGTVFWLTFETPPMLIAKYFQNPTQQKIYKLSDVKIKVDNKKEQGGPL